MTSLTDTVVFNHGHSFRANQNNNQFFLDDSNSIPYIEASDGCIIHFHNLKTIHLFGNIGQNAILYFKGRGNVYLNINNTNIGNCLTIHLEGSSCVYITGKLIDSLHTICDGNSGPGAVIHRDSITNVYNVVTRLSHPHLFLSTRVTSSSLVSTNTFSNTTSPLPQWIQESRDRFHQSTFTHSNVAHTLQNIDTTIRGESEDKCLTKFISLLSESTRTYVEKYLSKDSMEKRIQFVAQTPDRVDKLTDLLSKRYEDSITLELFHVPVLLNGKWQEFMSLFKHTVKQSKCESGGFYLDLKNAFDNLIFKPADIGAGYIKWEEFEEDLKEANDKLPDSDPKDDKNSHSNIDIFFTDDGKNGSLVSEFSRPIKFHQGLYSNANLLQKKKRKLNVSC